MERRCVRYSHGGGATYDLSEELAMWQAFPQGALRFTGYIDAVDKQNALPETRLPLGMPYHYNVWQSAGIPALTPDVLQGNSVPGADLNDNVDVQNDSNDNDLFFQGGLRHTKVSGTGIAENPDVQAHLLERLRARVSR